MKAKELSQFWFQEWEKGDFLNLPITVGFIHQSPFGTIEGKTSYLELIEQNKDKFLGYTFQIEDALYQEERSCFRYKAIQSAHNFSLDVSEWHYIEEGLIKNVIAYYHIGEIKKERELQY